MKVDDLVRIINGRLDAAAKTAVDAIVEDAQTPVAKGGRMRVDTGFLRNSIAAAVGSMPSGPSDPRADAQGRGEVGLVVEQWSVRDPLYVGWTANYAVYREAYDGFMEGALQNWAKHVSSAVQEAAKAFR